MGSDYKAVVLQDSPWGYCRLDESSGTSIADSSGNSRTGTKSGAAITYSQTGAITSDSDTCLLFAAGATITLPTSGLPTGSGAWSMEAWAKFSTLPTAGNYPMAMNIGNGSTAAQNIALYFNGDSGKWGLGNNGGDDIMALATASTNTWYHLCATYAGGTNGTITFYINGTSQGTLNKTLNLSYGGANLASNDTGGGNTIAAYLDECAIYTTALSSTRVSAHYTTGIATTNTRTVPATAALQSTLTRTVPDTAALKSTLTRTVPDVAALQSTLTRTIPATAALAKSRIIPASAALQSTLARTIPATAALTVTSTRIIPATAALYVPTIFYASNVASTIGGLTQSDQMSMVVGGVETSVTVTAPASGANSYVELVSQGGTPTATSALPAPTGLGWSIDLHGNTIVYGPWFSTFTLAKSGTTMSGASLVVRWYRRTMDGICYPIGVSTLSSQSFSTAKTAYTTPSVTATLWQGVVGDTLYMDAFVFNAGTAWASDVFTIYVSNSATQGVVNDGTITAPSMITTPAGLSSLIGLTELQAGSGIPVLNQSFTLADALDQRSVLTLTGEDSSGTRTYIPNQPVMLSDSNQGLLYTGYLASDKASKVVAGTGSPQVEHMMTFADHHRGLDKRVNTTNYLNWSAGDMICDFIQQTLNQECITGEFALESDYTPATLGAGTLSGTVATTTTSPFVYAPNTASPPITSNTGDLELTRAGTQFTLTEATTSDFSSGTLTNMTASNNELVPNTQHAFKVVASYLPLASGSSAAAAESGGSQTSGEYLFNEADIFFYNQNFTIGTNDTFNYDIWISSTSPAFLAGIDINCSDGTQITGLNGTLDSNNSIGLVDSNGVSVDKLQDLSGYAKDCWYTRSIPLTGLNGKTVINAYVYINGSSAGITTVFVKNCYFSSAPGSPLLSTTMTQTPFNPPTTLAIGGYLNSTIFTSIVSAYNPLASYRVSSAHSIAGVGLVQNSSIAWTASLPTAGGPVPTYPPGTSSPSSSSGGTSPAMIMLASYDGNTWLQCTNSQALPGLPPGSVVSGLSLYLREQFSAGSDPSAIPALLNVQITINSAANQTVSDVVLAYGTTSQWNTGTTQVLTGPNANGNLTLGSSSNPLTQTWSGGTITNQTFLAGWNNAGTQALSGGAYTMTPGANASGGTWCQSRFDFAGYFLNGVIEADLKVSSSNAQCGIEYRQSGWGNGNNTGAYYVAIDSSAHAVSIGYGNNSFGNSAGTFTTIIAISETINSGTFYHIKIVVQGNRHTVYFNHGGSPIIDLLDNQYPSVGNIGFRAWSSGTSSFTATIDNFSLITTTAGTWTSPNFSLTTLGTCGYTQVCWSDFDSRGQTESTTTVLASIDGGSTWQQCTNGAEIPQLARGTNVSSAAIMFQMILQSATPSISAPIIMGLYARICGNYGTVSGTRVSPVLPLTPVGYVAFSNCMWNANVPTSTSVAVATSQDASTWTSVGGSGAGASLGYWTNQPSATQDLFNTVTSANYTNTSKSGGSAATATYNTTNSRIILSSGSGGLYLNTAINCADIDLFADMDESDTGGLCWHVVNTSNYYELGVYDASSSGGFTNQLRLYKVNGGTRSLLGSASAVTFTRGTFHRIRVTMKAGLICVYWDGQCAQSYLDTSPLGSGQCGLRNDSGTSRYYQLYVQPLGTNLSGQTLYTKVTMSTSDPSQIPQLFTLVAAVRGPSIATGATINQLHPITLPFAAYYSNEVDALIQASGDYYWYVDKWRKLWFGPRLARPGAFPLQSMVDSASSGATAYSGSLLYVPTVSVTASADPLRNQQVVTNVSGLVTPPTEVKVADGSTTSWTLGYPVYSAPTILVNGSPATVGVQGIDNGYQFYWQPGSTSISYDSSLPKLPAGTIIDITYVGQSTVNTIVNNSAAQSAQAAIELNSGIIGEIESALKGATNGMTSAQATTYAQGLLSHFGFNDPTELIGTTLYGGIAPGTVIPVFVPELGKWNTQLPVIKVTTTAFQGGDGIVYLYAIDATNGANLSQWQRVWF